MDTSLFERATQFAIQAHSGTERRGKGFPYILHPMEAATIVATVTSDPEMLAAAILHDTVEDTGATLDQITSLFGPRVARLVANETSPLPHGTPWRTKRQAQINQLRQADRDSKIVAIGDKLSNLRAIAIDHRTLGDTLWSRFHAPGGKTDIAWYYRNLAEAFADLGGTAPYREFTSLIEATFPNAN